ncbi:MAG: hypothetical protein ACYCPT_13760 [Acidimicrobiales bacterium]
MTSPTPREALEAERRECEACLVSIEFTIHDACPVHRGVLHGIELAEQYGDRSEA